MPVRQATKARDEAARDARRVEVAERYCRGETQSAIAAHFGVTQACISLDLQKIRKAWEELRLISFNEKMFEELAKIDRLERMANDSWDRSCQDYEERQERFKDGGEVDSRVTRRGQCGDPRFLERIGWCIEQRIKLLGLSPEKIIQQNNNTINVFNADSLLSNLQGTNNILTPPTPIEQVPAT